MTPGTGSWEGSSVWGPLRCLMVKKTDNNIIISTHFDLAGEVWDKYGTTKYFGTSTLQYLKILGAGSNFLAMGPNEHIWSKNIKGTLIAGKYHIWSIHTYLLEDSTEEFGPNFNGVIISEDGGSHRLGHVYFKKGQWVWVVFQTVCIWSWWLC